MPPQGCACGHKALAQRELQLGPLPVYRALSPSNSPARQDALPVLGRAGRRQAEWPPGLQDRSRQPVRSLVAESEPPQISRPSSHPESPEPAWMLWTPPWRSSEPSACREGPRASRVWPDFSAAWTGMEATPWMWGSSSGAWLSWGWCWTQLRRRACAGAGTVTAAGRWTWRSSCERCGPPCPRPGRQSSQRHLPS